MAGGGVDTGTTGRVTGDAAAVAVVAVPTRGGLSPAWEPDGGLDEGHAAQTNIRTAVRRKRRRWYDPGIWRPYTDRATFGRVGRGPGLVFEGRVATFAT